MVPPHPPWCRASSSHPATPSWQGARYHVGVLSEGQSTLSSAFPVTLVEDEARAKFPVNNLCFRQGVNLLLMRETGASEEEKSILIASPESNPSQFSTCLETGSWLQNKHTLSGTTENENPFCS